MSNYTVLTNYAAKDGLVSGNPAKLVRGADLTAEFNAVQTALNSKVDGTVVGFPDNAFFANNSTTAITNTSGALGLMAGGVNRISVATTGAISIAAPTAANSLSITGVSGHTTYPLFIQGAGAAGSNNGALICAGANSSDGAFTVNNSANTVNYFVVQGDGQITMSDASGAATQYRVGYLSYPTSVSTTAVLADKGKGIVATGTVNINNGIFAAGDVLYIYNNSGASISISGTITTLRLAGTATTGGRTIAQRGLARVYFVSSSEATADGPGVT